MKSEKLNEWLQIVGIAAVVSSLIFVGMELRQDQDLARAELASQSFQSAMSLQLTLNDPDFSKTYAKMLDRPEDLTIEEMLQINSVLEATRTLFIRECYLTERGVFAECDGMIQYLGATIFGNRYANSWWRSNRKQIPFLPDWVDSEITEIDIHSYQQKIVETKEDL